MSICMYEYMYIQHTNIPDNFKPDPTNSVAIDFLFLPALLSNAILAAAAFAISDASQSSEYIYICVCVCVYMYA